MRILLITERFGDQIPTGVISRMMAEELHMLGNEIAVVSSEHIGEKWTYGPHIICNSHTLIPKRVLLWVSNLLGVNLITCNWRRKALFESKRIAKSFKPDIVYARSTPVMVCEVAAVLKKELGIPVMMHFTDPVPAPIEWDTNLRYRRRMIATMNEVLPYADSISFGNASMMNYQQSLLSYSFLNKSFVVPDPVRCEELYDEKRDRKGAYRIVYLGALYGNRNPRPLFESLETLNKRGYSCELVVYDVNRTNLRVPAFVSFVGRTDNVRKALLSIDLLLNIDGDDSTPVFISSKLKEYLCCCRPILSITPAGSPSRDLTDCLTTVFSVTNQSDLIEKTLISIMNKQLTQDMYKERETVIQSYTPHNVARMINDKMLKQ